MFSTDPSCTSRVHRSTGFTEFPSFVLRALLRLIEFVVNLESAFFEISALSGILHSFLLLVYNHHRTSSFDFLELVPNVFVAVLVIRFFKWL